MTLTKEEIKRIATAWKRNGAAMGVINAEYLELCRLALLGLERDKTIFNAQSAGHKAGRAAASVEYESEIKRLHGVIKGWELKWSQRDERAERIGRAVLDSEGACNTDGLRIRADAAEQHDWNSYAELIRAIADAMEEP